MQSPKSILILDVSADLMSVMSYYEAYCMMECCGTNAVDLSPIYAVSGIIDHGAERGLTALDGIIAAVEAHDGPVHSDQNGFGHHWDSSSDASRFLVELHKTITQGIAHVRSHGFVPMPSVEVQSLPN